MFKSLKNFLSDIRLFFFTLNILIEIKKIKPKFVFYSEKKSYQKYAQPIIEVLSSQYPNQVYYFSSDKSDKFENKNVKNFYISNLFLGTFFNPVKAENMFLTVTDLGNHFIKKTKNIDKYIFYFHSTVSTTKTFTPKAFDNYDIIMCNGQFHINEIRSRESLNKLKKKSLIPTGFFYFDYLLDKINFNINPNEILIAPSWNYSVKNFINKNFIELIEILLKKNFNVIFRPHPEHLRRSKIILDEIKKKFLHKKNFTFDIDDDSFYSMEKANCLITDSSGIAIEYMIIFKRPVLYLDEFDKIHNPEFSDYSSLKTIDNKIKDDFGYLFKKNDFYQIDKIIDSAQKKFQINNLKLDNFIKNEFFNYGKSKMFLLSKLKELFNSVR